MLPDVCLKFSMYLNAFSRTVCSRIDPSMQVRHACTNSFSSSSIFGSILCKRIFVVFQLASMLYSTKEEFFFWNYANLKATRHCEFWHKKLKQNIKNAKA
ncbi:hypothetical protein BpHYR1_007949 [Brachionus plicatilis]|uniref:Uncharacterized protein n=1 Tax=Brachionus plicatilis TaxID=10195 RepID=A0A3M7SLP2_BRAPC|nr:hypothetical protein BpHYR1_007949 [Brachionus plicatilis]